MTQKKNTAALLIIGFLSPLWILTACTPPAGSESSSLSIPAPPIQREGDEGTKNDSTLCANMVCPDGLVCRKGQCFQPNQPPVIDEVKFPEPMPATGPVELQVTAYDSDQEDRLLLHIEASPNSPEGTTLHPAEANNPIETTLTLPTPPTEGQTIILVAEDHDSKGTVLSSTRKEVTFHGTSVMVNLSETPAPLVVNNAVNLPPKTAVTLQEKKTNLLTIKETTNLPSNNKTIFGSTQKNKSPASPNKLQIR
ncbi:MAG: hypothetical protein Q7S98_07305 [Deltaproteobacteria bacterium]|nr:hypothetical protein [Deltaproteobacteria bacterium]